jgi:hypothetical protein
VLYFKINVYFEIYVPFFYTFIMLMVIFFSLFVITTAQLGCSKSGSAVYCRGQIALEDIQDFESRDVSKVIVLNRQIFCSNWEKTSYVLKKKFPEIKQFEFNGDCRLAFIFLMFEKKFPFFKN